MTEFYGEKCFIKSELGYELYKEIKDLPIYDYHCHLSPKAIAEDEKSGDIGELWLSGDHYKWRLMRMAGFDEEYITGSRSYKDKFMAFAKTLEYAMGSPVYHFAHLELKKYFGINEPLSSENAEDIYERANAVIAKGGFSTKSLIKNSNVKLVATTDDPADSLIWHGKIAEDKDFGVKVVPSFRPDKAFRINDPSYPEYIKKLAAEADTEISCIDGLKAALAKRMDAFVEAGSRIADHGVDDFPHIKSVSEEDAAKYFAEALAGNPASAEETEAFLLYMLDFCAREYNRRDIVMQLHLAALRNVNSLLYGRLGPDIGGDIVGALPDISTLRAFMDRLFTDGELPKMILYSLNPYAYLALATLGGSFAQGGRVLLGNAWWFNDHVDGIREQIKTMAVTGLLGKFTGMLTDSRSFLSYARHDYFRRILCNYFAEQIEDGGMPLSMKKLLPGICFGNAEEFFGM